jgi:hypothetical protein
MPKIDSTPKMLRPWAAHGVILSDPDQRDNCRADCPFCGREGKLSVSAETGSAHCWACQLNPEAPQGGVNLTSFLRRLWEVSAERQGAADLARLAAERGFAGPDCAAEWGAAISISSGEWLLPGRDASLRVCQLYRWAPLGKGGKRVLVATPKAGDLPGGGLFCGRWDPDALTVWLCEGPWDGISLDEALSAYKAGDDAAPGNPLGSLRRTSVPEVSLRAGANVAAVPGAGAAGELLRVWLPLFRGKDVVLAFDADDAGRQATERAGKMLLGVARSVRSVAWPDEGSGGRDKGSKDVRDILKVRA